MLFFNSSIFIFFFLPAALAGYFIINHFGKYTAGKYWLLAASLFFYGYFNPAYLGIIVFSILWNFLFGRYLSGGKAQAASKRKRRGVLACGIVGNVLLLFFFKYFDFLLLNVNTFFGTDFVFMNLLLPLGISFFTFQQIAYLVDTYRGDAGRVSLLDYSLFVSFFPKIIQGPIALYGDMVPQFNDPSRKHFNFESFSKGFMAFSFGLAKKVVLADSFGKIVTYGYTNTGSLTSLESLLVILGYTFQIYFDFSGYCDMAQGIGMMFHIDIPQNFNSPYKSLTILDFWKRWHITLTRFFTRYVYIPLGGSRKGNMRTYLNVMIIFLISGLWHGAGYTFLLWGLCHGLMSVVTRIFKKQVDQIPKVLNWLITFLFINATWVIFRADSVQQAGTVFSRLFSGGFSIGPELTETLSNIIPLSIVSNLSNILIAVGLLFLFAFIACVFMKNTDQRVTVFRPSFKTGLVTFILFVYSVLSMSGISTFLYVNF